MKFLDGDFTFYVAWLDSYHMLGVVFRVRHDTTAEQRAKEKNIEYWSLDVASPKQIAKWLEAHPTHIPIGERCD